MIDMLNDNIFLNRVFGRKHDKKMGLRFKCSLKKKIKRMNPLTINPSDIYYAYVTVTFATSKKNN